MRHAAKIIQAFAIALIAIGFAAAWPEPMSFSRLLAGIAVFTVGWLIEGKIE